MASKLLIVTSAALLVACGAPQQPTQQPVRAQVAAPIAGEIPSRQEVMSVMGGLRWALSACGHGREGVVTMLFEIQSAGTVSRATVRGGSFADNGAPIIGSGDERCLEDVARSARFAPFSRPTFTVSFPFVLRRPSADASPAAPVVGQTQQEVPAETLPPPPSSVPHDAPAISIPGNVIGGLDATDLRLPDDSIFDDYTIALNAGQTVTIVVRGGASTANPAVRLDMYTFLMRNGAEVTHDDDSAGQLNSRIIYTATQSGNYVLRVNTYGSGSRRGAYAIETWSGAVADAQ